MLRNPKTTQLMVPETKATGTFYIEKPLMFRTFGEDSRSRRSKAVMPNTNDLLTLGARASVVVWGEGNLSRCFGLLRERNLTSKITNLTNTPTESDSYVSLTRFCDIRQG